MTRLFNDPDAFADEMVEGFVSANAGIVRRVRGGVVKATETKPGTVAVVIGGGSGHYPAFGGLVGPGMAHGAAMGNLFASPSTQQVQSVATEAHAGGGVLFTYGNYAGDVLNFDLAQERLIADGIDCRTVAVTDDISSAPREKRQQRRGIAGGLAVYKTAAAAAEAGYSLDDVERVAALANERTRSFGVAFSGCTLPGADAPLFEVPEGRMAVGLGVHGEPGIAETDVPTADGLASLLVSSLLDELPEGVSSPADGRVVALLNGLGSVKYEELFVVYRRVAALLGEAGATVVEPEVGEMVTSFDMAGLSLTLFWLDDELERLWAAPAMSPAYRKGFVGDAGAAAVGDATAASALPNIPVPDASAQSQAAAAAVAPLFDAVAATIAANVDALGTLDSIAGDGDHGIGMERGARAAAQAAAQATADGAGLGTVFQLAGDAWSFRAGGTSGALWGLALDAIGASLADQDVPDAQATATAVGAALAAIQKQGNAKVGDKTMVDALQPFAEVLSQAALAGNSLPAAWIAAADAAVAAAAATADLEPKLGRARPLAEKSKGHADPGAHSFGLIVSTVGAALQQEVAR